MNRVLDKEILKMRIIVTFENGKTDSFPMTAGVFVNDNKCKLGSDLVVGDIYMDKKIVKVEVK